MGRNQEAVRWPGLKVYNNGNVRGRNMLQNAHKDKHTGEYKDRQ